jgi:3-dehydroquinate dehydratase type I
VTPSVCAPIAASTVQKAMRLLRKAEKNNANLIEFRLDHLEKNYRMSDLISSTRLPRIATNRSANEGGKFRGEETNRVQSLLQAAEAGCEFVDLELAMENLGSIIRKAKRLGAQVIISYHDFQRTPDLQELRRILEKQMNLGADICKIVSTAKEQSDNLRILEFVFNASRKTKVVSFAMGKLGVVSRVLSPIYGASFTFASVERGAESAAGQLTLDEIRNTYRLMRL